VGRGGGRGTGALASCMEGLCGPWSHAAKGPGLPAPTFMMRLGSWLASILLPSQG